MLAPVGDVTVSEDTKTQLSSWCLQPGGQMDPFTNTPNPRHMGVVLDKRCENGEKGVIAGVTGEAS